MLGPALGSQDSAVGLHILVKKLLPGSILQRKRYSSISNSLLLVSQVGKLKRGSLCRGVQQVKKGVGQ